MSELPVLSNNDILKFSMLFDRSADGPGSISGGKAKEIFLKANLDTESLGKIWGLCDLEQNGVLDKREFVVAMHLLQLSIHNHAATKNLPSSLPAAIWDSASGSGQQQQAQQLQQSGSAMSAHGTGASAVNAQAAAPQRAPAVNWSISRDQKMQYDQKFDALDNTHEGKLSSNVLVPFFMSTGLNQETLANIWDLADVNNNSFFTKQEFAIAMHLILMKNSGISLPESLPNELISSLQEVSIPSTIAAPISASVAAPAAALSAAAPATTNAAAATIPAVAAPVVTALPSISDDKAVRANKELARVNEMKSNIESKLNVLKTTHDSNVRETESLESQVISERNELKVLEQQLAALESSTSEETQKMNELNELLLSEQTINTETKQKLQNLEKLTQDHNTQISENQIKLKQMSSMVDVNTKQHELNKQSFDSMTNELQSLTSFLSTFALKITELNENQQKVEAQHAASQTKYKELESKNALLTETEADIKSRTDAIQAKEAEYHSRVDKLQSLFDQLASRKSDYEKQAQDLQQQHMDYAHRVQSLSDSQMKLALGGLPDDAHDMINKYLPGKLENTETSKGTPQTQLPIIPETDLSKTKATETDDLAPAEPAMSGNGMLAGFNAMESATQKNTENLNSSVDAVNLNGNAIPNSHVYESIDEEFPPIQTLEYDVSDTSSEESNQGNTAQTVPQPANAIPQPANTISLDDEFADLQLAAPENNQHAAAASIQPPVSQTMQANIAPVAVQTTNNEEWDNLFSGLDDTQLPEQSQPAPSVSNPSENMINLQQPPAPVDRSLATTPKSLAMEELRGMGFGEQETYQALEKFNWDLDAATNYLLDGA